MYPLQTQILSEKFTQSFSLSITTDRRKVELMVELCNRPFFICPSSQNAKSLAKKFKYSPIWTISDICLRRNKKPTVGQVSAIVKSFRPTDRKKCTFVLKEPIYLGTNSPTPFQWQSSSPYFKGHFVTKRHLNKVLYIHQNMVWL